MAYSDAVQVIRASVVPRMLWPALLAGSFVAAYSPTIRSLIDGPWQTEQEGHGPLIIAASAWLLWQSRQKLRTAGLAPAPVVGWSTPLFGLFTMSLARTQGVLTFEVLSVLPVIAGCVLLLAGWPVLRILG